jgi:nicotinamide-nucleotide adenylyltransferase
MSKIFFLGRFQPFHLGHLQALLDVKGNEIVICVGSTNRKDSNNPFPYSKRKRMIEKTLKRHKIKARMVAMPDHIDDIEWMKGIGKIITKKDIIYSGNNKTIQLFREHGYKTKKVKIYRNISGTLIRSMMGKNSDWKFLVPEETYKELK